MAPWLFVLSKGVFSQYPSKIMAALYHFIHDNVPHNITIQVLSSIFTEDIVTHSMKSSIKQLLLLHTKGAYCF